MLLFLFAFLFVVVIYLFLFWKQIEIFEAMLGPSLAGSTCFRKLSRSYATCVNVLSSLGVLG